MSACVAGQKTSAVPMARRGRPMLIAPAARLADATSGIHVAGKSSHTGTGPYIHVPITPAPGGL